jgi:hypothetical protein
MIASFLTIGTVSHVRRCGRKQQNEWIYDSDEPLRTMGLLLAYQEVPAVLLTYTTSPDIQF